MNSTKVKLNLAAGKLQNIMDVGKLISILRHKDEILSEWVQNVNVNYYLRQVVDASTLVPAINTTSSRRRILQEKLLEFG